jgi:hypothetical protein
MNYSPVRDYARDQCSFGEDLDAHAGRVRPGSWIEADKDARAPSERASEVLHREVLNQ